MAGHLRLRTEPETNIPAAIMAWLKKTHMAILKSRSSVIQMEILSSPWSRAGEEPEYGTTNPWDKELERLLQGINCARGQLEITGRHEIQEKSNIYFFSRGGIREGKRHIISIYSGLAYGSRYLWVPDQGDAASLHVKGRE